MQHFGTSETPRASAAIESILDYEVPLSAYGNGELAELADFLDHKHTKVYHDLADAMRAELNSRGLGTVTVVYVCGCERKIVSGPVNTIDLRPHQCAKHEAVMLQSLGLA